MEIRKKLAEVRKKSLIRNNAPNGKVCLQFTCCLKMVYRHCPLRIGKHIFIRGLLFDKNRMKFIFRRQSHPNSLWGAGDTEPGALGLIDDAEVLLSGKYPEQLGSAYEIYNRPAY